MQENGAKKSQKRANITKTKKMSNVRSSGADDKAKIVPAIKFSLEEALEYIQKDEYVEVTPNHLRLRKILLTEVERKRSKASIGLRRDKRSRFSTISTEPFSIRVSVSTFSNSTSFAITTHDTHRGRALQTHYAQ